MAWAMRRGLERAGLSEDEARRRVLVLDSGGLLVEGRARMESYKLDYAQRRADIEGWTFAGDSPDLLLTDVAMPELDGVGLASELSRMKLQLPIIFMSSSAPKELSDRFASERLDWPSEAFVSKPFQLVHIVDAIEGALNALPDTQEHLPLF